MIAVLDVAGAALPWVMICGVAAAFIHGYVTR
jgi:hypothetical protein